MEIEMKLLAIVVLGILFAATLARADETAVKLLHKRLDTCDADEKQTGVPMHGECSEAQFELSQQYSSYAEYRAARTANQ
jgi:hypothetical protein